MNDLEIFSKILKQMDELRHQCRKNNIYFWGLIVQESPEFGNRSALQAYKESDIIPYLEEELNHRTKPTISNL